MGFDPDHDPRLQGTSERVVRTWSRDLLSGHLLSPPHELLAASVSVENHGAPSASQTMVVLRNIATVTVCPHHLLPAIGFATILYTPAERVAGLGTLARLVDYYARSMILQEEIGQLVADALVQHLGAHGAACRLSMLHTCLVARGETQHNARLDTVAFAGEMAHASPQRDLALAELAKLETASMP